MNIRKVPVDKKRIFIKERYFYHSMFTMPLSACPMAQLPTSNPVTLMPERFTFRLMLQYFDSTAVMPLP